MYLHVKVLEKLKYEGCLCWHNLTQTSVHLFLVQNKTIEMPKKITKFWHLSCPLFFLSNNFKCNYLNISAQLCCCYSGFLVQTITVGSKNSYFRETMYKIIKRHTNLVSFFDSVCCFRVFTNCEQMVRQNISIELLAGNVCIGKIHMAVKWQTN